MGETRILVPYNFTLQDNKAVSYLTRSCSPQNISEIMFMHLYTPAPEVDVRDTQLMQRLKDRLTYMTAKQKDNREALNRIKETLVAAGYDEKQIRIQFKEMKKDVADEILDAARAGHYHVILLSRRPGQAASRLFSRSVHHRVINSVKDMTVSVVT
jgi:hypothetical protein